MEDQKVYKKAKMKIDAKFSVYIHLAFYVGVNIFLVIINLTTSPDYLWAKWPLLGWGIGLFFHGLAVFFFTETASIREQMIKKEMKKELTKDNSP